MHSLSISMGAMGWALTFKDGEDAKAVFALLSDSTVDHHTVADDFGQTIRVRTSAICGMMLEDLDVSKLGAIERALHQQRTQQLAQKMSENDASLRVSRMTQGTPMFAPQGPNGRFQG